MINASEAMTEMDVAALTNYKLPLKITREAIEHLPPLERAYALHLCEKYPGQVFEIQEVM